VKAAFLYRFASYVEWPEAVGDDPFVIAIVGAEDVAKNLDELLPNMTLQGRRATVRRVTRPMQLEGVRILYVGPEMLARARDLRAAASERPILLVTEGDENFASGGVINFLVSNNKVRFEVSLTAAERAHLRIDSALLGVAARVDREPRAWLPGIDPVMGRGGEAAYRLPRAMLDTELERLN
jgi:YfiR/HmsC-like